MNECSLTRAIRPDQRVDLAGLHEEAAWSGGQMPPNRFTKPRTSSSNSAMALRNTLAKSVRREQDQDQ